MLLLFCLHASTEETQDRASYLSVDTFLKVCAGRLNLYEIQEYQSYSLPEEYDRNHLVTVHRKDSTGSIESVQVYDPDGLLINGQNFTPQDKALSGTRTVGFYSINGKRRLCFKQWPEAPWTEGIIRVLYQKLFPSSPSLPNSEVILMNGQVFLVSEYIEGDSLESFLKKAQESPADFILNLESFQKLVIFCMLINPEDCRLQNCLVRQVKDSREYQIVIIDNERSCGPAFIEEIQCGRAFFDKSLLGRNLERKDQLDKRFGIWKVGTRVHCALFCFYEMMSEHLQPNVLEEIKDSISIIDTALAKQFDEEDKYQKGLKEFIYPKYVSRITDGAGKTRETIGAEFRETILGNNLGSWFLERIFYGWPRLVERIQRGKSCVDIFIEVHPRLAELYAVQSTITQKDVPNCIERVLERIQLIDAGRNGPKTPPSAWLPMRRYFRSSILPYRMMYPLPSIFSMAIPVYHLPRIIEPENWIGVVTRSKELFTESMDEGDRAQIIESVAEIFPENWEHIKEIAQVLFTEEMRGCDYAEIIEAIKRIDREQKILKEFLAKIRGLEPEVKDINDQLTEAMINMQLIKLICGNREFTAEEKSEILEISGFKDIATRACDHFPRYMEVSNYIKEGVKNIEPNDPWVQENLTGIIEKISATNISPEDWEKTNWEGIIARTKDLFSAKSMDGFDYSQVLEAVKDISSEDWPDIKTRVEEVIAEGMRGGDYAEIIEALKRTDMEKEEWLEMIEQYRESIQSYSADQIATLIALRSKHFFVFRRPINEGKDHTY